VVLTSDALVERSARRLGFRQVARIDAWHTVSLEGVTLLTTPSYGAEVEWGVMAHNRDGTVYNQVDTVMRSEQDVRAVVAQSARVLEHGGIDLALVRWQPLLEVEALIAGDIGFPFDAYADLLDQIAALDARAVVPASASLAHAAPHHWMNRCAYPLSQERFARDLVRRHPASAAHAAPIGSRWSLSEGAVHVLPASEIVTSVGALQPQSFAPLTIPPLCDPNLHDRDEASMRTLVSRWVADVLAPALAHNHGHMGIERVSCALEIVYPNEREHYTLRVDASGCVVSRDADDDHDVLNQVAASQLCDVIEGKRHWGEPLLAGLLRSSLRAYRVDARGLSRANVAAIFLYYALSYEQSTERWIDTLLGA
jgi:hypothetical protein